MLWNWRQQANVAADEKRRVVLRAFTFNLGHNLWSRKLKRTYGIWSGYYMGEAVAAGMVMAAKNRNKIWVNLLWQKLMSDPLLKSKSSRQWP